MWFTIHEFTWSIIIFLLLQKLYVVRCVVKGHVFFFSFIYIYIFFFYIFFYNIHIVLGKGQKVEQIGSLGSINSTDKHSAAQALAGSLLNVALLIMQKQNELPCA